jgi:hypothetical protein
MISGRASAFAANAVALSTRPAFGAGYRPSAAVLEEPVDHLGDGALLGRGELLDLL